MSKNGPQYLAFARSFVAVCLLPLVLALVWEFFRLAAGLARHSTDGVVPFWIGLAAYMIFQVLFARPLRTYVFGHELTHAVVGILSGARLKSFRVSAAGGSVVLTKTSVWIALAPYFLPIYTLAVMLLFWVGSQFWNISLLYPYFLFAAGFSLSFHYGLTSFALSQEQTDLKEYGVLFSGVMIFLLQFLVTALLLKILFPETVNLRAYLVDSARRTVDIVTWLSVQGRHLWESFPKTK
jgi:hypothetical protein